MGIWVSSLTSFQKSKSGWPQQPPTAKVLWSNMRFHDCTPKILFSKHQIKPEFKNLDDSEVLSSDFPALTILQPLWPHRPQQPHWPHWSQLPYFIKELPDSDGLIISGTKKTNSDPLLWNGSSNIQYFTDIWYLSVGGCWGQPMLLFWKLVGKTQMPTTPEATRHHNSRKLLILPPLRAI